jgi:hypothetical protein
MPHVMANWPGGIMEFLIPHFVGKIVDDFVECFLAGEIGINQTIFVRIHILSITCFSGEIFHLLVETCEPGL